MSLPTESQLRSWAADWFAALDRHDDAEGLILLLADDELEMHFPEEVQKGHAGFRSWYNTVTHRFFDEAHELKEFEVTQQNDMWVKVSLVVNWQAKVWDPPQPHSKWLGFDAAQTWELRCSPETGKPQIVRYIVDRLEPMPGSASL